MIAYHGTTDIVRVLREGLKVERCRSENCGHICLSKRPEQAAEYGEEGCVLAVDVSGLDHDGFFYGELRVHEDIPPSRIRPLGWTPKPSLRGWIDPTKLPGQNHPGCLRRMRAALPLEAERT